MHFFNSFGAAHQLQEATSFPEVTGNEIESRHGNPRSSLGNWATRSPHPSLADQFLALLYEHRLLRFAVRQCPWWRRERKPKDERARQITVTVGSLDWIISQSQWPYVFDPLLAHRATISKKTVPDVARAEPTAISLCLRQEKHTMHKLEF